MSAAVAIAYPVARGVLFIVLLLSIGSQAAVRVLATSLQPEVALAVMLRQRILRAVPWLFGALTALIVVRGMLQVLSFVDPGDPLTTDLVVGLLFTGGWGHAWTLQIAMAVLLTTWCGLRRSQPRGVDLVVLAGLLVVLWAQSGMGHASGTVWHGPWGQLLDTLHLIGAGIWLGTLTVLFTVAFPALRDPVQLPALFRVVRTFSGYAKAGVGLVLVSGVTAAVVYAGSVAQFLGATWGRLLLIKVALLGGVLVLGWYNWRVATPALQQIHRTPASMLRRAVRIELALGLLVLGITAVLVATALPGES